MYDLFDEALSAAAAKRNLQRVHATITAKPGTAKGFVIATTTEPWVFKGNVHALIDLELDSRRDNLHHRSSGLDSTSAKLCARSNVLVLVNLANLRSLDPVFLGRVQQNILLCRKHGAPLGVVSSAKTEGELPNERDVQSLLVTLGASPGEAKRATQALTKQYEAYTKRVADK
jgi:RNase P/RNase MRP subunit p30